MLIPKSYTLKRDRQKTRIFSRSNIKTYKNKLNFYRDNFILNFCDSKNYHDNELKWNDFIEEVKKMFRESFPLVRKKVNFTKNIKTILMTAIK